MVETRRLRTLLIGGGSLGRAFLRRAAVKDSPVALVGSTPVVLAGQNRGVQLETKQVGSQLQGLTAPTDNASSSIMARTGRPFTRNSRALTCGLVTAWSLEQLLERLGHLVSRQGHIFTSKFVTMISLLTR